MIKLTIIIPFYKTHKFTDELIAKLAPQVNDSVQVLLIYDEGAEPYLSNEKWLKVVRQPERGVGRARNYGIRLAVGEYIAFIDSDDLVTDNYIQSILDKIDSEDFDLCKFSWKTISETNENPYFDIKLTEKNNELPDWNWACWSRLYKRSLLADIQFPDGFDEDVPFVQQATDKAKKITYISEYMYLYRLNVPDSRTFRHSHGEEP